MPFMPYLLRFGMVTVEVVLRRHLRLELLLAARVLANHFLRHNHLDVLETMHAQTSRCEETLRTVLNSASANFIHYEHVCDIPNEVSNFGHM